MTNVLLQCEDILAVGICVEETKLLPVTSLIECQTFLQRVEQLQPCLERVLSTDYSALCSPGCLKHLDTIKWAIKNVAELENRIIDNLKTNLMPYICHDSLFKWLLTKNLLFYFLRSVWQGLLLVAAFIEKVVIKMKVGDERIKALTLKHCSQLHGVSIGLFSALFITFVHDICVRETPVAFSLYYETILLW